MYKCLELSFNNSVHPLSSENRCLLLFLVYSAIFTSPTRPHPTLLSRRDALQFIHHSGIHNPCYLISSVNAAAIASARQFLFLGREEHLLTSNPGFTRQAEGPSNDPC